jgi:hypothetical protein
MITMNWKDKFKNGLKKTGSLIKKGAITAYKEFEKSQIALDERVSILRLLEKEQLKEISKKFDIDAHDSLELAIDEKPSEPTRDEYIDAIADKLSLEEIKTALISIKAEKRVFDKVKEVEKNRRLRESILKKRFLESKDEMRRAREAANKGDWPEVLNHIRVAIDLAIKEKFGFKKIQPMSLFIKDAETMGLPLPSHSLIYDYFDEGSKRLHNGLIHDPLEAKHVLNFVEDFINELNSIPVDENKLNEFKSKCKFVE